MPPPNYNRKKKNQRKTSNKSYLGKKSSAASKVPSMPPLRPVAAAPGPPVPPRAVSIDRSVGPCDAMGDLCPHKILENLRHFCYQCNEHCHAIPPCGIPHPGFVDKLICNKCLAQEYPAVDFDDDDDAEASDDDPVGFEDGDDEMDRRFREANEIFMKSKSDSLNVDDVLEENRRPLFDAGNPPSTRGLANNPRNLEATLDANKSDDSGDGKPAATKNSSAAPPAAPVRRGKEYTGIECKCMATSWCQSAEDPKVGTGQKKEVFDRSVYTGYCNLIKEENEQIKRDWVIRNEQDWPEDGTQDALLLPYRDQKKISTRLGELKLLCNKFKGIQKQTPLASGEDEESHTKRCMDLYELQYSESFAKFYDAHCQFSQCHKWILLDESKDRSGGSKGRKKPSKADRDLARAQREQSKRACNDGAEVPFHMIRTERFQVSAMAERDKLGHSEVQVKMCST